MRIRQVLAWLASSGIKGAVGLIDVGQKTLGPSLCFLPLLGLELQWVILSLGSPCAWRVRTWVLKVPGCPGAPAYKDRPGIRTYLCRYIDVSIYLGT